MASLLTANDQLFILSTKTLSFCSFWPMLLSIKVKNAQTVFFLYFCQTCACFLQTQILAILTKVMKHQSKKCSKFFFLVFLSDLAFGRPSLAALASLNKMKTLFHTLFQIYTFLKWGWTDRDRTLHMHNASQTQHVKGVHKKSSLQLSYQEYNINFNNQNHKTKLDSKS